MLVDSQSKFVERAGKTVAAASRSSGIVQAMVRMAHTNPAVKRAILDAAKRELASRGY